MAFFLSARYWKRHYLRYYHLTEQLSERDTKMEWSYEFGRRVANGTCFRISFPEMRFFYGPIVLWILVL